MVHEAVKTDLKGLRAFVVDRAAESPQLPGVIYYAIEASHSAMCKFESKSSPGYLNVSTQIKTWVQDSPPVIQLRWMAERRERQQVRENEAKELLGIYTDPVVRPTQGSSANTPSKLHPRFKREAPPQGPHQIGFVEAPQSSKHHVFETAEVEERDEEMVDR